MFLEHLQWRPIQTAFSNVVLETVTVVAQPIVAAPPVAKKDATTPSPEVSEAGITRLHAKRASVGLQRV